MTSVVGRKPNGWKSQAPVSYLDKMIRRRPQPKDAITSSIKPLTMEQMALIESIRQKAAAEKLVHEVTL